MKYWDMCASEALMRGNFGIVTDKDRKPIYYDDKATDYTIPNGVLFARSRPIYDLCYERSGEYLRNLKVERGKF